MPAEEKNRYIQYLVDILNQSKQGRCVLDFGLEEMRQCIVASSVQ